MQSGDDENKEKRNDCDNRRAVAGVDRPPTQKREDKMLMPDGTTTINGRQQTPPEVG